MHKSEILMSVMAFIPFFSIPITPLAVLGAAKTRFATSTMVVASKACYTRFRAPSPQAWLCNSFRSLLPKLLKRLDYCRGRGAGAAYREITTLLNK
uniref:Secreted protein n=1 Tax=Panagrellus redivivus TaxID=6233 RepID=A0A7E4UST8_PANRE